MATKTIKFPLPEQTEERKYSIADTIAQHCAHIHPEVISANSKFYFREIINSPISIRGTKVTVAEAFTQDDAMHITNLVLKRLQTPMLISVVSSVEV